jgi:hypothetical protein
MNQEKEVMARWLRSDVIAEPFPREVSLHRDIVDEVMFWRYFDKVKQEKVDAYASVFSLKQIQEKKFDTILFDIDAGKSEADAVIRKFRAMGIEPRVIYTGHRWHVYVDFEPRIFKNYKKAVRRYVAEFWSSEVKAKILDSSVFGDIRRMARLVGTWNTRGNDWAREISVGRRSALFGELLLQYDVEAEQVQAATYQIDVENYPPCIQTLIEKMKLEGDLDHNGWLVLGAFYAWQRKKTEAMSIFKFCKTYDEDLAEYQLNWLIERQYMPPSCAKIQEYGLCPMKCKYFPWMALRERKEAL